jgi:hypothetical protein
VYREASAPEEICSGLPRAAPMLLETDLGSGFSIVLVWLDPPGCKFTRVSPFWKPKEYILCRLESTQVERSTMYRGTSASLKGIPRATSRQEVLRPRGPHCSMLVEP